MAIFTVWLQQTRSRKLISGSFSLISLFLDVWKNVVLSDLPIEKWVFRRRKQRKMRIGREATINFGQISPRLVAPRCTHGLLHFDFFFLRRKFGRKREREGEISHFREKMQCSVFLFHFINGLCVTQPRGTSSQESLVDSREFTLHLARYNFLTILDRVSSLSWNLSASPWIPTP